MSDLQRSFAKAKIADLPFDPPLPSTDLPDQDEYENAEEADYLKPLPDPTQDDDSSSASSASSASSTGTIRPSPSKHLFARPKGYASSKEVLDPLPWNDYFSQECYLTTHRPHESITHHVYLVPPTGKAPLLVLHHGAGSSGLSFALFSSEIRKALPNCGVLSLDARGHGETTVSSREASSDDGDPDLSLEALSQDLADVIGLTKTEIGWTEMPDIVLIGHSLGGPVVVDLAVSGRLGSSVLGCAVLDVVEGSAMDALQSMQQYLATRPKSFPSLRSAIEWHTRTRTVRSATSARISVPSLMRRVPAASSINGDRDEIWKWRTELSKTEHYWSSWFNGLSSKFLSAKGGKLLILAGTDRLDKELMIGQMQGKYQLQVFPEAGHFVQEDCAGKTAAAVADFVRRNDRAALVLPPKVGEMPRKANGLK